MDEPSNPQYRSELTWAEFAKTFPGFTAAVNHAVTCISRRSAELPPDLHGADKVVALLTASAPEDITDILILCASDRGSGALKLLRGIYEKIVIAKYISAHPDLAEDFLMYDAIHSKNLLDLIAERSGYKISSEAQHVLDKLYAEAQIRFKRKKCSKCGEAEPRNWTRVTPLEMAKDVGLGSEYFVAYRYSTLLLHPSYRGVTGQLSGPTLLLTILGCLHHLAIEALFLHWTHFKKTKTLTGEDAEACNEWQDVWRRGDEA